MARLLMLLKQLGGWIILVCVLAVSSLLLSSPYFFNVNNIFIDGLHTGVDARKEIVIVGIDDASLNEFGQWPWNREVFARGVEQISSDKPKVIAFDVLFLETGDGDTEFRDALQNADTTVILGSKTNDNELVLPEFTDLSNVVTGYTNVLADSDGKTRRGEVSRSINGTCEYGLGFKVFTEYTGSELPECENDATLRNGEQVDNEFYFTYTSEAFEYISFSDVVNGNYEVGFFKNKIVMIGVTVTDIKDKFGDNFIGITGKAIPGVEIHANIVNSFLDNRFRTFPNYPLFCLVISSIITGATIFFRKQKFWPTLAVFGTFFVLNIILGMAIFDFGINWYFWQGTVLILVGYAFSVIYRYLTTYRENLFIRKAFAQYLNEKLLSQLMTNHEALNLGGEEKYMTVMFSDIRGFTTMSEGLTPTELVDFINDYLNVMSGVILNNDGTIDKYIGDAIMAFWNAPVDIEYHEYMAITTAMQMVHKLHEFNTNNRLNKQINIGIGLNTGAMTVGNVGSSKRFDYTVLGDNVNLGSRIEGLTKKYYVKILATEDVVKGVERYTSMGIQNHRNAIVFRIIDEVVVKGKTVPIKLYEPIVAESHAAAVQLRQIYEKGFALYQSGNFKQASVALAKLENDDPAKLLIERIKNYGGKAPKRWNGVWVWDEK